MKMRDKLAATLCGISAAFLTIGAHAQNVAPFRIGVLNDQSSVHSTGGGKGAQVSVELAVADFGGKVLGRPIEVLSVDHQNKVDVATGIAREWLDSKGVNAIFDLQNSAVALAVIPIVQKANRIAIVSGGASSEITGKACTPLSFHWTYDSYSLSRSLPKALIAAGKKNWYLINSDYTLGATLERDMTDAVTKLGGKVVDKARVPLGATNYSSTLLRAEASKADVIMLGGAGADLVNQIKQAQEFGMAGQQVLATPFANIVDVNTLGLAVTQGLFVSEPFYWDLSDETRAWSKRYIQKMGIPATSYQAGNYSSALHYLKAVAAAGTADGAKVAEVMRGMPVNDMMTKGARIREDGRLIRDMYLFRVKTPAQSKHKFDFYEVRGTIAGADAFRPVAESECPLLKR